MITNFKIFENRKYTGTLDRSGEPPKLRVGDYVYPKPECCKSVNILKPMRYRIDDIYVRFGHYWCAVEELTNQSLHSNEFDINCFVKETPEMKLKYNANKYNI